MDYWYLLFMRQYSSILMELLNRSEAKSNMVWIYFSNGSIKDWFIAHPLPTLNIRNTSKKKYFKWNAQNHFVYCIFKVQYAKLCQKWGLHTWGAISAEVEVKIKGHSKFSPTKALIRLERPCFCQCTCNFWQLCTWLEQIWVWIIICLLIFNLLWNSKSHVSDSFFLYRLDGIYCFHL